MSHLKVILTTQDVAGEWEYRSDGMRRYRYLTGGYRWQAWVEASQAEKALVQAVIDLKDELAQLIAGEDY